MSQPRYCLSMLSSLSSLSLISLLSVSLLAAPVSAEVRHEGQWPDDTSEKVSLSFEGPRSQALRELAAAAGWSVVGGPLRGDDSVNLYVTDQPATKVLDVLLSKGDYVVKREGKLLSIAAASPASPSQAARPQPHQEAKDRTVFGSSAVISRAEVVDHLTLLGGSTELLGTVQEDVLVLGGSLKVRSGGHVLGDVTVLGGAVELDDGAQVDGDLSTAGGHVQRATGALVRGEETSIGSGRRSVRTADHTADKPNQAEDSPWSFAALLHKLGGALSRTALLYAFGCVLLAAIGRPMQRMQHELSEHPMRAFAVGVVAAVGGAVAIVALCVTIIGIPIAILLVLAAALGVYAGMCAVLLEIGALVLEERTPSPYAHLGFGCLVYLIFSTLPIIGWVATCAAVLCGLGLLISTQVAGLFGGTRLGPGTSA